MNLKGILVGNGVTDQVFDGNAWIPFIFGHSFISDILNSAIVENCGPNYWNASSNVCNNLFTNASNDVSNLNIYDVYIDCYLGPKPAKRLVDSQLSSLWHRITSRVRSSFGFDVPCIDSDRATAWLNQDDVRTALHAISVEQQQWTICSGLINYTSIYTTVIPIHKQLLANGYRILIYSGDSDMCVPNTGSEAWTISLGLPVVNEWRPWFVNQQVAGYVRTYKGLTYATIKGAGHMVPQFKPPQALYFFSQFLNNQPF